MYKNENGRIKTINAVIKVLKFKKIKNTEKNRKLCKMVK